MEFYLELFGTIIILCFGVLFLIFGVLFIMHEHEDHKLKIRKEIAEINRLNR